MAAFARQAPLCRPTAVVQRAVKRNGTGGSFQSGRASREIWGGKHVLSGNWVSFSKSHSRRTWYPNVVHKKFWSPLMERFIDLRVTTNVLRTIEKKGGIDSYLLVTPKRKLDVGLAHTLRGLLKTAFVAKQGKAPGEVGGRSKLIAALDAMNPLMQPPGALPAPPRPAERVRGPPAFPSQKRMSRSAAKQLRKEAEAEAMREAQEAEAAEKRADASL